MAGTKGFRFIQLGQESSAGTAVAATTIWRGNGMLDDKSVLVEPEEDTGFVMGGDRIYIPKISGELPMEDTEATFEQILHLLAAGVKTVSGVQDGAGTGYVWTYPFPTTAQNTVKTYTVEGGDDQQAEEMAYCFVREFGLKGKAGEALMMSATWEGRQISPTTKTGALALPTIEEILFSKGKLYIDPTSTFPATTQKTNTFLEMDLKVTTGFQSVFTGDGNLYFSFIKQIRPVVTLDITFEHDATSVAEKAAWRAGTSRALRILWTGSALATAGTHATKKLIVDLVGKWNKFDKIGEQNGNDIVKGTLSCKYNGTAASAGVITVVNEISAIP